MEPYYSGLIAKSLTALGSSASQLSVYAYAMVLARGKQKQNNVEWKTHEIFLFIFMEAAMLLRRFCFIASWSN